MAQKNLTAYIILGMLAHEDASGYDLKKRIDLSVSQFWDVGYGQLYPTLRVLEQGGFIAGRPVQSEKGPDCIVYAITDSGRQKLAGWLALPEEKESVRYEILLKLFFGSLGTPEEAERRIHAFRERQISNLELIGRLEESLRQVLPANPDHTYYYLTALFGEHLYRAYVEWAEEAAAVLRKNITGKEETK